MASEVVEIIITTVTKGAEEGVKALAGKFSNFNDVVGFAKRVLDECIDLVNEFGEGQLALAKLDAVMKATGNSSLIARDNMINLANAMQTTTMFADEETLNAEALMATFKNINENVFPQAIKLSADLSSLWGMSLDGSIRAVGKALDDPIEGMSALRRYGIQLSDSTEDMIKSFVALGDIETAQGILLDQLKSKVGGVSEAIGQTAPGKIKIMNNAISDLKEGAGKVIWGVFEPFVDGITGIMRALGGLQPYIEKGFELWMKWGNFFAIIFKPIEAGINLLKDGLKAVGIEIEGFNKLLPMTIEQQKRYNETSLQSSASAGEWGKRIIEEEKKVQAAKADSEKKAAQAHLAELKRLKDAQEKKEKALAEEKEQREAALENIGKLNDSEEKLQKKKWKAIESAVGHGLTATQAAAEKESETIRQLFNDVKKMSDDVIKGMLDGIGTAFEAFGAALVTGEDANKAFWISFGNAAKEAIARGLEALGQFFIAQAVAKAVSMDFIGAALSGLAATACFVGAGVVRAIPMQFAKGGEMIVSRPSTFVAGEAGAERITVSPLERERQSVPKKTILSISGQQFDAYIQDRIDRGHIRLRRAGA